MTFILGLTGSIGMGKSTVAGQFRQCGVPVVDADALVHQLMTPRGEAFNAIARAFPQALENGLINRQQLGRIVFAEDKKLRQLEQLLHPQVRHKIKHAIRHAQYGRVPLMVLEIPLLFETNAEMLCDAVVVVTAPYFLQRQRVMRRAGMTEEKFRQILQHQMPDAEKRRHADWVIPTGSGKAASRASVFNIVLKAAG